MIFTEANENVASGHLIECIVIARVLIQRGHHIFFWINQDIQDALKKRISFPYLEYNNNLIDNEQFYTGLEKSDIVIFNLRYIQNNFLNFLKNYTNAFILCIDELGNRKLDCDIIINNMLDSKYHNYFISDSKNPKKKIFVGPKYLILPETFSEIRKKDKPICSDVHIITISMGGVDRCGATLKLTKILMKLFPKIQLNIILGGGFLYKKELDILLKGNIKNITLYYNLPSLAEVFFQSDLVFCAGGNTLYELACLGTPALVIYSATHEKDTGKSFEELGFGKCLDDIHSINASDILEAVKLMDSKSYRQIQYQNGRKIVDGLGFQRITDIIEQCTK